MTVPLLFILGNHRSGTTWLYQLLAGTGALTPLTAYHVITWGDASASRAQVAAALQDRGISERQLDGVAISPDLPEEYCYILNNEGFSSWSTRASLPLLRAVVSRLREEGQGRPVVLKNPWDYANFELLAREFPEARFVFLHRHPLRVVHSALAVFRVMMEAPDAYLELLSRRYAALRQRPLRRRFLRWFSQRGLAVELFAGGVRASNDYYLSRAGRLGERAMSLRYEDLCADPGQQLGRILDFLGLTGVERPAVPARPGAGELPPELTRRQGRFNRQMRGYLERMGYGAEP